MNMGLATAHPSAVSFERREYCSWGRYPRVQHRRVYEPAWADEIQGILQNGTPRSLLPYGLGRSYGDSCLNSGRDLVDCSHLDRVLGFDFHLGRIRCEAGMSLAGLLDVTVPQGWFLPVTPGTKFVTIGGAIANDVHGKNHHRAGTFGSHLRQIALQRSDRELVYCGPDREQDLFRATIGGLGLTGIIEWAEIQLLPIQGSLMDVETVPFQSLDEFLAISRESDTGFEYTVAWVDCLSGERTRGIFYRGNHSSRTEPRPADIRPWTVPFVLPDLALNWATVGLFNKIYYARNARRQGRAETPYESFFYPLDAVRGWNLVYGKRGFLQYQCVIPPDRFDALRQLMPKIGNSGMGSFLAVLKCFGSQISPGMLSFPRPGYTLALDFAMRGPRTLQLMNALDEIVLENGGALYPAKDARMTPRAFELSFPGWRSFRPYIDPKLSSSFWRRVTGEE